MRMTEALKAKIALYIKNGADISDIIEGVDIRNANLGYAVIKRFNRVNDDISGCNFAFAKIGEPDKITNLCGTKMHNCNFFRAVFLGTTWFRRTTATNCNFTSCDLSKLDYKYCDFRNSTFCHAIIRIGSMEGMKAKFSKTFFNELVRVWDIDGMSNKSEEELEKIIESEVNKYGN